VSAVLASAGTAAAALNASAANGVLPDNGLPLCSACEYCSDLLTRGLRESWLLAGGAAQLAEVGRRGRRAGNEAAYAGRALAHVAAQRSAAQRAAAGDLELFADSPGTACARVARGDQRPTRLKTSA
jgi:hypothetical protein